MTKDNLMINRKVFCKSGPWGGHKEYARRSPAVADRELRIPRLSPTSPSPVLSLPSLSYRETVPVNPARTSRGTL